MISLEAPPTSWLDKFHGSEAHALYCGQVRVKGGPAEHGRASGIARSDDGALAVELRLPIDQIEHWIGRAGLGGYFGFFLFAWAYTRFGFEQTRPVPERVT